MWEHRTVSNKSYEETKRILPSETYVKLMDQVEAVVTQAEVEKFDAETFMSYIPRRGPWEEIPASDHSRADARTRYIGPAEAKLLNTNLVLGSSWIDSDRFKFERSRTQLILRRAGCFQAEAGDDGLGLLRAKNAGFAICRRRIGDELQVHGIGLQLCLTQPRGEHNGGDALTLDLNTLRLQYRAG